MASLTLEHLSAYLPYGLEVKKIVGGEVLQMMSLSTVTHKGQICIETYSGTYGDMWFKPILRPLSQLMQEIEHNGESFVPVEWFEIGDNEGNNWFEFDNGNVKLINNLSSISEHRIYHDINYLPFAVVQKLLSWHFDVFGLIDKGLAIKKGG